MIKNFYDWDRPGAEKAFKRGLDLNPNSEVVHRWYAFFLMTAGRLEEALVEINRALDLEPLSVVINRDKGHILYRARQHDRAIEQLQKTLDLDPNFPSAYGWLVRAYEAKGAYEQAITADLKMITLLGGSAEEVATLREAYTVSGWKGYWRKRLNLAKENEKRSSYAGPSGLATLYARLGEKNQAFAWLEKSYQERSSGLSFIKVEPILDGLRSDPRFTDMLQRIGLEP